MIWTNGVAVQAVRSFTVTNTTWHYPQLSVNVQGPHIRSHTFKMLSSLYMFPLLEILFTSQFAD